MPFYKKFRRHASNIKIHFHLKRKVPYGVKQERKHREGKSVTESKEERDKMIALDQSQPRDNWTVILFNVGGKSFCRLITYKSSNFYLAEIQMGFRLLLQYYSYVVKAIIYYSLSRATWKLFRRFVFNFLFFVLFKVLFLFLRSF